MKIFKKISIITIIIILTFIGNSFAKTGKVTASAVRIRKEMSTESDIITNIYEDDEVEILEEKGDWYKIKYQTNTGYVKKEFIKVDSKKDDTSNNTNKVQENSQNTNTNSEKTNTISNNTNLPNNTNTTNSTNSNQNTNTVTDNSQNISENVNNDSIKVVANTLIGLKLNPNLMSITVAQFEQGKELTKETEISNWVKVTDGFTSGWVNKTKVSNKVVNTEIPTNNSEKEENKEQEPKKEENNENKEISTNQKGTVKVETANIRKTASESAERIGFLDYGDTVTITAVEGDWYKITAKDISGYVSKKLITLEENKNITSRSLLEDRKDEPINNISNQEEKSNNLQNNDIEENNNSENKGTQIAEYAKGYLGTKYIVGGKNPETGFDCSGFTRYVYSNFGYNLGTTSSSQSNCGGEISRENMQEGDLIIFYNEEKSNVGHTAIYLGNGNFVHSANPQRGVVIDNLNTNTYYNERFISARRIAE